METKGSLFRFLIVNEDSIRNSELFSECTGLNNPQLIDWYRKIKTEHAGKLFFLNYALDILRKEREELPKEIKKEEEEYALIGNEHVKLIDRLAKKNRVSDEFLKMAIKMYATYEMNVCSQVEFSILEGLFNSIEKTCPYLNDDLKVLLESYKKVYKCEVALDDRKELYELIDEYIDNIDVLRGAYIRTFGFNVNYIKREYRKEISELSTLMDNMFNIISISDNGISAHAIGKELSKYKSNYMHGFAMLDFVKNYRVHGDGVYLDSFIEFVGKKEISERENGIENDYYKVINEGSQLLIKYLNIIKRMKRCGVSFDMELDLESESKKIRKIINKFYEERIVEKIDENDNDKKENVKKKVLRVLNTEEIENYFSELDKLQIRKIKNIADAIVVLEKQDKIINTYALKKDNINCTQMKKMFERLDQQIKEVYDNYVKDQLEMLCSYNTTNYMRKKRGLEPLEQRTILYRRLFSSNPNGIDLDERIERKNHFYVCNFNKSIGIMTFPYANIASDVESCKCSRVAIIYDTNIHSKIVSENRGASWASDPNERVKKEINGKEKKVYTGNRLIINNNTHNLQEVISKAIFTEKKDIEEINSGKIPYLSSHKFDYRKGKLALHFPSVVNGHEKSAYYSVDDVAWISSESTDLSKYKAMLYMDSAEELKEFIENL